jgi:hypothetical protein
MAASIHKYLFIATYSFKKTRAKIVLFGEISKQLQQNYMAGGSYGRQADLFHYIKRYVFKVLLAVLFDNGIVCRHVGTRRADRTRHGTPPTGIGLLAKGEQPTCCLLT